MVSLLNRPEYYNNPYKGEEYTGTNFLGNPNFPQYSALQAGQNYYSALPNYKGKSYGVNQPVTNKVIPSNRQPGIGIANQRAVAPATTGAKTPPNWRNNLLNYVLSPKGQGMAQGLLEASGYSETPISFGQALAMGMQRGTEAEASAAASQLAQDELAYRKEQDKILNSLKLQEILAGITSGSTDTAKIKDFKFYKDLSKDDKELFDKLIRTSPENALAIALANQAGSQGQASGIALTPYEEAVDTAFAKKAVDFESGGFAEVESNLDKLEKNIKNLSNRDDLTGWFIGSIPDKVKAITHPDAVALKDDIRSIIFQSLRETLGAQFTQKEGERLVDASFNDMLDESINLERMQRLFDTTLKAANAKKEQIAYFKKNGTLKKWEGETFTYESIASDLYKKDDYKNFSKDQLEEMFVSPNVDEAEAKIIEQILKDME